jgi:polysaccharide biosynthesis protein PslH
MRILFVVPYTPNLIRVRPYNLIRHLAALGHEITVGTLTTNEAEKTDAMALSEFCTDVVSRELTRPQSLLNCLIAFPSREPLQAAYCWQPDLAHDLANMLFEPSGRPAFDVIHIEHLRGARYGLFLQRIMVEKGHRIPTVWDSVDCISFLFEQAALQSRNLAGRWMTRIDLGRTRTYEGSLITRFDRVLVTSPKDKQELSALAVHKAADQQISVLPNGVDLAYFEPSPINNRESSSLVISGKMSYHANVTMVLHLVQDIMPQVWASRPEVTLTIVGKDPPHEIRALDNPPQVIVTGTVPDIRPFLWRASLAVAPIQYGAGIQNKVLEAMACATPVVVSSQAATALTAKPGRDFLVADSAMAFAEQIIRSIDDPLQLQSLSRAGRSYVEASHNWRSIATRLAEDYERVMNSEAKL